MQRPLRHAHPGAYIGGHCAVTCGGGFGWRGIIFFSHTFAEKLLKTINYKQTTAFIAIKRRPHFSIINYLFNFCCLVKAKSIREVSKIYQSSRLLALSMDIIEVFVLAKPSRQIL